MKKIINGKRYDTETAEYIADYSNHYGRNDFRSLEETLYRTPKGNFFLAGEGGPMTKYARPCGGMTGGGEDIIPLTKEEAFEWAEAHMDTDEIVGVFGDMVQDA
jgi:hypothetical protein